MATETTEKNKLGLTKKQVDAILIFAYFSIVVGYGILVATKLSHSKK